MNTSNPDTQSQETTEPSSAETPPAPAPSIQDGTRKTLLFTYVLYIVGLLVGLATIIGLIIAYIKRKDAKDTWMESHFTWLIRTFWIFAGCFVLGLISMPILHILSMLIIFGVSIWYIYRVVKGLLFFNDNKPLH